MSISTEVKDDESAGQMAKIDGPHYWNYRVIRESFPVQTEFEDVLTIHEVYYDSDDKPEMWTEAAMHPQSETVEGLRDDLTAMLRALDKPVINKEDLPGA